MAEVRGTRSRGRPRKAAASTSAGGTRALIERAASEEFAERGYEAASMRAIARRAGVDSALVHHYFSDKSELFAAVVRPPLRPDKLLQAALDGPVDTVGSRLVRALVSGWDAPGATTFAIPMLRTVLGHDAASRTLKEFIQRELLARLAGALDEPDAELRAALAASQLVGLIVVRYVIALEPLASASVEEIVRAVGPVVQRHLFGDAPLPPGEGTTVDSSGESGE